MRAQLKWVVGLNTFEICVTNADGTHLVQPTDKALFEGTGGVVRRWAESHIPEARSTPTLSDKKSLQIVLARETPLVDGAALAALEHDLEQPHAGVDQQRPA
jgi:hypothetical protein